MDDLEKCYGKQTFLLYALFAKVPGKELWPRIIFLAFSVSLLSWATVIQLLTLVIEKFEHSCVIELLPTTLSTFACLLYIPYVVCSTEADFKALLSVMLNDLRVVRNEKEYSIKQRYYRNGRIIVNGYVVLTFCAICCIALVGISPYFLDLLVPLNGTRERRLLVRAEFFVDEQKYYYLLYFLECCSFIVVAILVVVTENMGIIIGQHACGMSAVLGYRLENVTNTEYHKSSRKVGYHQLVTKRIFSCIEEHKRFTYFGDLIAAFYDIPLTIVLMGTLCTLTVSLVQATSRELVNTTNVLFSIAQVLQLYILSYMGQCGIDYTENLRVNAYNVEWHNCSPNQRRILQLIILRTSKPCVITARKMYTLSMENFISVMQTVTSFYVVLRQNE